MRKIKKFIKSTCISSRILFAVWLFFALFIKSTGQSKLLTMFEMGVVFLLPAVMTEIRRNPVFSDYNIKCINIFKNTKIASRVLIYFWLTFAVLGGISIESFIYSSILFLLPTLIIECNKNPIIKRNDAKIAAEQSNKIELTKSNMASNDLKSKITDQTRGFDVEESEEKVHLISQKQDEYSEICAKFSDVDISGEEEHTQPIPQMNYEPVKKEEHTVPNDNLEIHFDYESLYQPADFIKDMKQFEHKEGKKAEFVPFMQYYPTYSSMDKQQKEWYFYWRSQVRKGIYLDTDLSYIFVHIYELLSGYGINNADDGYKQLLELWKNYRKEYPKLDGYLFEWIFDFCQLYNLDFEMPGWTDLSLPYQPEIKNVIISKHSGEIPLKLTFALIDSLCDYSLVRSKFYNDGHQMLMNEAIPRVVALADAALYKKEGKGILDKYGPNRPRKQTYYAFRGANCKNSNQRADITVKDYINSAKLRAYINELVRYAENVLRELYNCRGRLRGVSLDDETAKIVKAFLHKEYSPIKYESVSEKKTEINLNFDNIKELRTQSDAVRDALEVEETSSETKELLTDLKEAKEIFIAMPQYCRNLIDELQKHSWEIDYNSSCQASIDIINGLSGKLLACDLLVVEGNHLILEDDYRDEFDYLYEHLEEIETAKPNATAEIHSTFDLALLSEEMRELFETFSPYQEEIICVILSRTDVKNRIDKIAEAQMSMPEILVDEINDIASQYIGDILIDTFGDEMCILEQYLSLIHI